MAVKVPPLLHKMSLTAQRAWYKKHGMEMPAAEKSSETKEKSAAVAKRVKVEPRKTIAVEPGSVRALNAARQQAYMAKGGRQPIGAMGSGGSNVMAGAGQSTIKDLKASIKAGFNPRVSLDPYQGEKETKKKKVEEASKPDASMAMTHQLKMKMISDKDKRTLGKVAALMAAQKNKDKKNEYVRQLGLKAMKAGEVDPARGHSPTRFGREALKKEEVESVEEGVATAQKVMDRASVVAKTNPDPKKRFAASGLARKAMLRTINPTGVNTGIVRGGGNKTYRMLGKVPPYQLTKKTGVSEEVEQIDEIKISDVIKATRGKSPEEKQKIIQQMRNKENASKPKTAPRKLEPPKDIPMHQRVYPDDMKYHGDSVELEGPVMNEVTKKEAEAVIGGPVKEKPKMSPGKQPAGYRYVRGLARKAMKAGLKKEEVEVNEAIKDAADVGEYDYEGDMAKSQLRSILTNAKRLHDMLEDQTNLPEWVQSKITLAEDYILTAANYMEGEMNEEVEQVDEKINLVKAKMGDVIKDFQKSDAPQFKGKSQEERRKMALAAKLGAEREAGMREEVEQTDEAVRAWVGRERDFAIRRPADQAERDKLASDITANRKYNKGKKIGASSGSVRKNASGLTPSQRSTRVTSGGQPINNKQLGNKQFAYEEVEVVAEAEGKLAVTPKEKELAAHHGDKTKITYGDVIKARIKSAAEKAMKKGN